MARFSPLKWLDDLLNPISRRMSRDMEIMRQELASWKDKLVPLAPGEWELISSHHFPIGGRKRRRKKPTIGMIGTIYQEPVAVWDYKAYPGKGDPAVLVVRTHAQEYLYKIQGPDVELVIGPYLVGLLRGTGKLYSSRKKVLLARMGPVNGNYLPIQAYDREVGAVALPSDSEAPFPRAFAFMVNDMNENERELFLALGLWEVVRQTLRRE